MLDIEIQGTERKKKRLAVAQHPTQHLPSMGVVLARAGKLAARANQNPPYAPAPGPAPLLPAPFRISANLSTLGSPRAWAATGWAGLTVLWGGPAPLRLAARGRLPSHQLPPKIPRGYAALGWLQRDRSHRLHPPARVPRAARDLRHGAPGAWAGAAPQEHGRPQPCSPSDNGDP